MRRYYSIDSYKQLVDKIRRILKNKVSISSDFIAGFPGETDQQFEDTLTLIQYVKYDQAFMFAYSQREKTQASRKYIDDLSSNIKQARLAKMITTHEQTLSQLQLS